MPVQEAFPTTSAGIIRKYNRLVDRRRTAASVWQELAEYMRPIRSNVTVSLTMGTKQTLSLFDGTAVQAASDLASAMNGSLTSNSTQWFVLKMRNQALNEIHTIQLWLEEVARRIYLGLQQSNFDSEANELYSDLSIFGTGAMLIEEKNGPSQFFNGYQFTAIHPGRYVIMENEDGMVDTFIREIPMTLQAIAQRWGKENMSEKAIDAMKVEPEKWIQVLHAVMPTKPGPLAQVFPRAWRSIYIEMLGEEMPEGKILSHNGYFEFPGVFPRWSKTSGEEYGRGQGHHALPDTRTINRAVELRLKAWAKAIDPPVLELDDGVIGRVKLTPGSRNVVRDLNALKPFEGGAKFEVSNFSEKDLAQKIRGYFFADQLRIPDKNFMTAFEVEKQIELMQRLLGPTLGRLQFEYLTPLIDRCFNILMRSNSLPEVPGELLDAIDRDEAEMDVKYESPLTRSQRGGDIVALDKTLASTGGLAQVDPAIIDNLDTDETFRGVADRAGLPPEWLKARERVAGIREDRAKQAEEQAQQEQIAETAKAAGKAAPAIKVAQEQEDSKSLPFGR